MVQKLLALVTVVFSLSAQASFSDLDIVVRESVERYSIEQDLGLVMTTLLYKGPNSLSVQDNTAIVTCYVQDASSVPYECVARISLPNMDIASAVCEPTSKL